MILKPGEKVRVRKWNDMEKEYGLNSFSSIKVPFSFTRSMSRFCGKIVTIDRECDSSMIKATKRYCIKEDNGCFNWSVQMFEPIEKSIASLLARR